MPSVREDGPGQTGSCISASAVNPWKPVSLMEIGFHRNVGLQVDVGGTSIGSMLFSP